MEWKVFFAWSGNKPFTTLINSMYDLEALYHKYGERLIVDFGAQEITVYDYYAD